MFRLSNRQVKAKVYIAKEGIENVEKILYVPNFLSKTLFIKYNYKEKHVEKKKMIGTWEMWVIPLHYHRAGGIFLTDRKVKDKSISLQWLLLKIIVVKSKFSAIAYIDSN